MTDSKVAESKVVDLVMKELPSNGFTVAAGFGIDRENGVPEEYKRRLVGASKTKSGNKGSVDVLAYSKTVLLVVECKGAIKDHGDETDTSAAGLKNKAIPGVLHYMRELWNNGNRRGGEYIYGLAISGSSEPQRLTYYGCNNAQVENEMIIRKLYDGDKFQTLEYLESHIWSFEAYPDVQTIRGAGVEVISIPVNYLSRLTISKYYQRLVNEQHVAEIEEALTTTYNKGKFKLMGVLQMVWCDRKYHLIDGQHRFDAYLRFWGSYKEVFNVTIQITSVDTLEEVKKLYKGHYDALEATEEEKTGEALQNWYCTLASQLLNLIRSEYKTASGTTVVSKRSAAPSIPETSYKQYLEELFKADVARWQSKTADELFIVVKRKNEYLRNNEPTKQKNKPSEPYSATVLKQSRSWGCWLGLIWPAQWFE